jgi:hypothetical protein
MTTLCAYPLTSISQASVIQDILTHICYDADEAYTNPFSTSASFPHPVGLLGTHNVRHQLASLRTFGRGARCYFLFQLYPKPSTRKSQASIDRDQYDLSRPGRAKTE